MSEYWERELDEPQARPVYRCAECGCWICVGDEAYQIGGYGSSKYICSECCGLTEVEEPERDWDFERKARLEADNGYF